MSEAPAAIWLLLMFLFFPLIDLGTVCLRSTFLYLAVRNAVRDASKARSFQTPVAGQQSATQIASTRATNVTNLFTGVSLTSLTTDIVITNISTNAVTRQSTPLATPADDNNYTYQLEVSVTGSVAPLICFNGPFFGPVPGLTQPMILTMTDRQYFENPQGLTL